MKKIKGLIVMVYTLFDKKYYFENQENIIDGVAIDPLLPDDFYDTPIGIKEAMERAEMENDVCK